MKVSRNFCLQEFLHPDFFEIKRINPLWLIDDQMIRIAQFVRNRFNQPVTINTWHNGGDYFNSGLRPYDSPEGALWSDHKFGRAIDVKVTSVDPLELQQDIIKHYSLYKANGLTTIEDGTPTWTHMSCRNTHQNHLFIIKTKYSK